MDIKLDQMNMHISGQKPPQVKTIFGRFPLLNDIEGEVGFPQM